MSKELIMPAIGVFIFLIAIWAVMTKCGKKGCCRKDRSKLPANKLEDRKSVKSSQSNSNTHANTNDIES